MVALNAPLPILYFCCLMLTVAGTRVTQCEVCRIVNTALTYIFWLLVDIGKADESWRSYRVPYQPSLLQI
jgi:hypothetical protein